MALARSHIPYQAKYLTSDAKRQSFATLVDTAVSENTLLATSTIEEDSDDWLNVDAGGFEAMLEQTMGSSNRNRTSDLPDVNMEGVEETPDLASEQAARLKALAEKVEDFVEGEGDLEGAKFDEYDTIPSPSDSPDLWIS